MQKTSSFVKSSKFTPVKGSLFVVLVVLGLISLNSILPIQAQQPTPTFYTTLDNATSLTTPVNGDGTGASVVTTPANDFVPGKVGNGVRIDANTEYARFAEIVGTTKNAEYDKGTITFWYQPNYANTDGVAHRLFGFGTSSSAGFIGMQKRAAAAGNDLILNIRDSANVQYSTSIASANYSWNAGTWVNIRVTWDTTVPIGTQNVHIYLNDVETTYSAISTGPITMPAESSSQYVSIGTFMVPTGTSMVAHGMGVFDDFFVYDSVVPPPSPDTTAPSVDITSPVEGGNISGIQQFVATASDDTAVAGVQFRIDGTNFGSEITSAPYEVTVNTILLTNAGHFVDAVAKDASGNTTTSSTINFNVNNQTAGANEPNFIILLADDMRYDAFSQFMPLTYNWLTPTGVTFSKGYVSDPLCCPSRASILTGLFAHNTGVWQNGIPWGGATLFKDSSTLATWLHNSGYRTALIGKYLNDYARIPTYIPPGWDEWHVFSDPGVNGGFYYNYSINDNGVISSYGGNPSDYALEQLFSRVDNFIDTTPASQPFMLFFTASNPHGPSTPDPRDVNAFPNLPNWRPPSFNEADVSDKPTWVKNLPKIGVNKIAQDDAVHRLMAQSLQSLDRIYDQIRQKLVSSGKLGDTYIIFISDNGLSFGEHRWSNRKTCVYEECIHVPFVISIPGATAGSTDSTHLVQNIDLAPTIASLANVNLQGIKVNGLNLMNIINNPQAPWRTEMLIEQQHEAFPERDFSAVHDGQKVYVEYNNGDKEFYNLTTDQYQMTSGHNAPANAATIAAMKILLTNLLAQ